MSSSEIVTEGKVEFLRKSIKDRLSCHSSMGFETEGTRGWIVRESLTRETRARPFSISRVSNGDSSSNDRIFGSSLFLRLFTSTEPHYLCCVVFTFFVLLN